MVSELAIVEHCEEWKFRENWWFWREGKSVL